MAFRRQDIPKTTRKTDEGGPRRLYPRFIKDRAPLPKVELAVGYLDGMVGRKRGDLSPDLVLELFGDPKLARCVLSCLADSYRYRTQDIAEVVGEEAATALAAWDLLTPADVRGHVYLAANARLGGFVAPADRAAFLAEVAGPLGLTADQLEELIHLDAERNQLLVRVGPRPRAEDVVARYNATLTLSILRHASEVTLDLPGLDGTTLATVCGRMEVPFRRVGPETVRLAGRRNALGSWSSFGTRLARCVAQLVALCPKTPSGHATVHLGEQTLGLALDAKAIGPLRPKLRAVAGADGVVRAATLAEEVAGLRRRGGPGTNGWTMRRAIEPIVVEGALVVPEYVFTRGQVAVAVAPVPTDAGRAAALAAVELANKARPTIALGVNDGLADVPALPTADGAALVDLLERLADGYAPNATPLTLVADELAAVGWVPAARLGEVLGTDATSVPELGARTEPLTADGEAAFVPGFGLCRVAVLDDLLDRLAGGPLDIGALRADVAARVGDEAGADALTLHLLSRQTLVATGRGDEAGVRAA